MITEETSEGLGTDLQILQVLFGTILKIANSGPESKIPYLNKPPLPESEQPTSPQEASSSPRQRDLAQTDHPYDAHAERAEEMAATYGYRNVQPRSDTAAIRQATEGAVKTLKAAFDDSPRQPPNPDIHDHQFQFTEDQELEFGEIETTRTKLTKYLPEPGYFVAGALAGGISRTATAPLDRLKVYLLVNTSVRTDAAIDAVKHGEPVKTIRNAGKPIRNAAHYLWKAGGVRTFFAGKHQDDTPLGMTLVLTTQQGMG